MNNADRAWYLVFGAALFAAANALAHILSTGAYFLTAVLVERMFVSVIVLAGCELLLFAAKATLFIVFLVRFMNRPQPQSPARPSAGLLVAALVIAPALILVALVGDSLRSIVIQFIRRMADIHVFFEATTIIYIASTFLTACLLAVLGIIVGAKTSRSETIPPASGTSS